MRTWPALLIETGPGLVFQDEHQSQSDSHGDSSSQELLYAALTDYAVSAIDEPSPDARRAFFQDAQERDRALTDLRQALPALRLSAIDVEDEDWAARSQANLSAVRIDRIVVAPPWDAESARRTPDVTTIVIQPSMGFGTGHHATTRLCLAALQRANVRGRSVIDVGTGSGVLAIAASLLGASPVVGIDDDADAIQSAQENLGFNPTAAVDLRVGDLRTSVLGVADIVLANLTGTLLIQAATLLESLVSPHGRLIVSGLMDHEEAAVRAAFPTLTPLERNQEEEWVCLAMVRPAQFL